MYIQFQTCAGILVLDENCGTCVTLVPSGFTRNSYHIHQSFHDDVVFQRSGNATADNQKILLSWWRHQMETFSALLAICAGNSPVTGEFPAQKASDAKLWCFLWFGPEKRLSKQPCETGDLRRHLAHYDVTVMWNWKIGGCFIITNTLKPRPSDRQLIFLYKQVQSLYLEQIGSSLLTYICVTQPHWVKGAVASQRL